MRYMLHLFSIAFAILTWPILFVANVIADFRYQPSARESLALDRLVEPVSVLPKMRSRAKAFVERALTHVDFSSGHFDPGRMAA